MTKETDREMDTVRVRVGMGVWRLGYDTSEDKSKEKGRDTACA